MSWLFSAIEELLPVIGFFVAQRLYGFAPALVVMTLLVLGLLVLSFAMGRKVPRFAVASTVVTLIFAVPSAVTGNAAIFQVSDTIINGGFAVLLLGCQAFGFSVLKFFFERVFAITDEAWRILSLRWGFLFVVLAVLNEVIRRGYSEDVWVTFKLVSGVVVLLFGCYQFTLSARMRIPGQSNRLGLRT